ncbi:MAG: HIT domain-containing protein [Actinomycetota bacterium]
MSAEPRCIFCRIAEGAVDADVVHATDRVVAFRDTTPRAPVHVLLIPREHVASVRELGADHGDVLAELFRAAAEIARAEGIDEGGWRVVTNVGSDAGQSVQHLHFHLLGGRPMGWPPG